MYSPSHADRRYILLAMKEALRSQMKRVKIGAVIVDGNYVVSKGFNRTASHPKQHRHNNRVNRIAEDHRCHAEINALVRSRGYNLTDCKLYVGRVDRKGRLADCRPCPACLDAINEAGISQIIFTTPEGIQKETLA